MMALAAAPTSPCLKSRAKHIPATSVLLSRYLFDGVFDVGPEGAVIFHPRQNWYGRARARSYLSQRPHDLTTHGTVLKRFDQSRHCFLGGWTKPTQLYDHDRIATFQLTDQ